RIPDIGAKAGLRGRHHKAQQHGVAQQQSRVRNRRRHPAVKSMLPEIHSPPPRAVQVSAALKLLEILPHGLAAPRPVSGQLRDMVPVAVVGRDKDLRMMCRAAAERARARIEDSLSRQIVDCIPLLLRGIGVVVDEEFPREVFVFGAERVKGGDLVCVRLILSTGFQNENAVTGFGKPHGHRPATGAGSYDNEVEFFFQLFYEHGAPRPYGTIDDRELLRKRAAPIPLIGYEQKRVKCLFFAQGQNWRAASTTNASFRRSSSSVTGLPATVLAKPHCGP